MSRLARDFKPRRVVAGLALAAVVVDRGGGVLELEHDHHDDHRPEPDDGDHCRAFELDHGDNRRTELEHDHDASSGLSGSSLLSKFQSGEHATFIATYKITSGSSKSLTSLTIAEQPPDSLFGGTTDSGTFKLITLGTKSYICTGGTGGTGATCFSAAASRGLHG